MSNPKDAFATIDPSALDTVVGGRRAASSSRADVQDQIIDKLNSLENAIRDLGRNQQQTDPMSQMMPFLLLSMMNQQGPAAAPAAPQPVVVQGGGGKKGW